MDFSIGKEKMKVCRLAIYDVEGDLSTRYTYFLRSLPTQVKCLPYSGILLNI